MSSAARGRSGQGRIGLGMAVLALGLEGRFFVHAPRSRAALQEESLHRSGTSGRSSLMRARSRLLESTFASGPEPVGEEEEDADKKDSTNKETDAEGSNDSWHAGHSWLRSKNGPAESAEESQDDGPLKQGFRMLPLGAAALAALEPGAADAAMDVLWAAFDSSALTHHCMFEAFLAVSSFATWIFLFESLHLWFPNASKHRLDGQPPVGALRAFGPDALDKAIKPIVTYLAAVALFHYFNLGPLLFGLKPEFDAPSFLRIAVEVVLGLFMYDLLFYPIHFSMHNLPWKPWRQQHERHHSWVRQETVAHNASETVYHSMVDGALQVATNIFVQQLSPWGHKHPLSRAFHNIIVTYLLVESHSGYDLPFMSHNIFPGIFGGSPHHEAHHRSGRVSYHQFFTYIDRALGRMPSDAPAVRKASPVRASSLDDSLPLVHRS